MKPIHPTKLPSAHPALQQLADGVAARLEVFAHEQFHLATAVHHKLLKQRRGLKAGADEIKVQTYVTQQDLAGRSGRPEQAKRLTIEFAKMFLHDSLIKAVLALEIIIEQSLVHAGFGRDRIRAGT